MILLVKYEKKSNQSLQNNWKPLLENFESLIKSAKETNDKRDTQPVLLFNFENDLTTSTNRLDSKTNPKSDE